MAAEHRCPRGHPLSNAPFEAGLHPFPVMFCTTCGVHFGLQVNGAMKEVRPLME